MPPRGAVKKPVRRATRTARPQRSRGKNLRSGRRSKVEVPVVEEKPEEVEEKPKKESWLDKLPPVIKPDEELHQQLSKKRKEERLHRVFEYCSLELSGILDFAFHSMDVMKTEKDEITKERTIRRLHSDFRKGLLTPVPFDSEETSERETISTVLEPKFSLEVQNYLRFSSTSMWKDLSSFFNCELNERIIHDPDQNLNEFLDFLQKQMVLFQQPYHPFSKSMFPFTICVIGPLGTGRTTVCQLLQKIFNINIIDVLPPSPSDNLIRKKKLTNSESITEIEPTVEYPLKNVTQIKATDDKSTAIAIAQAIRHDSGMMCGSIIVGFPNTKTQLTILEKAITQQTAPHPLTKSGSRNSFNDSNSNFGISNKSSTSSTSSNSNSNYNIQGLIFTINPNQSRERLIDPVTGNVYQEDFHMPGFLDFFDVLPTKFEAKQKEIHERLVRITVPEFSAVTSKQLTSLNNFESGSRKNYITAVVPKCDRIEKVCQILDIFISALFSKGSRIIPLANPLMSLARPEQLVKPGLCYHAIMSWRECLAQFGPNIADQNNLVSILGNRLDQMTSAASDRFMLYNSISDERLRMCQKFLANNNFDKNNLNNVNLNKNELNNNNFNKNSTLKNSKIFNQIVNNNHNSKNQKTGNNKKNNDINNDEENNKQLNMSDNTKMINEDTNIKKKFNHTNVHNNDFHKNITNTKRTLNNVNENIKFSKEDKSDIKGNTDSNNLEFSNFFKEIWELSLKARDNSLENVNQIVEKSGLLELVVELHKTPKLIFIALVNRLFYTRWFYDNFYDLFKGNDPFCSFLDDFKIEHISPPCFNLLSDIDVQILENQSEKNLAILPPNVIQKKNLYQSSNEFVKTSEIEFDNTLIKQSIINSINNINNKQSETHDQKKSASSPCNKTDTTSTNNSNLSNSVDNESPNSENEIFFDINRATSAMNVPSFQAKCNFNDTLKFVDQFLKHYLSNLEDQRLLTNVRSSLLLFKTFSISVKNKEVILNDAINNLRHTVSDYAYKKCSHEMENFSNNFRKLKNGNLEKNILFEYDFSGIRKEILFLANFSLNLKAPIIVQSIVSFDTVVEVAKALLSTGKMYSNMSNFLQILKTLDINEEEKMALELCIRILVCSECFSIQKVLTCFIQYPEEQNIILEMLPEK